MKPHKYNNFLFTKKIKILKNAYFNKILKLIKHLHCFLYYDKMYP